MSNLEDFLEYVIKNDLNNVKNKFKTEYLYHFGESGFTGFLRACNLGYLEIVKFFIQKDVDLELPNSFGWNGLHWAADNGHDKVVSLLLEKGALKEAETNKKYRAMHCAALGNREKALRVLLAHGCDYNARNIDNKTPLDIAIDMESEQCIVLLRKWIEYDKIFNIVRQRRLNDFIEAFLEERINVKEANSSKTVVDIAVESASHECLEHIFLKDLEENVLVASLQYTLKRLKVSVDSFRAQFHLYRSIILDLKDKFEDFALVNVVNSPWILTGESFLSTCVKFNRKDMVIYILKMLLEDNQTLNDAEKVARKKGFAKIGDIINQRKNFLDSRKRASYSRLHLAIQDNRTDVVQFILGNNMMDINDSNQIVGSPLCFALLLGHGECVSALLKYGVDVNVINKYNQTPLHIAIENGMNQFSELLVERTNNVDKRDLFGFTALHYATINGNDNLCRLLLNKGANVIDPLKILQGDTMNPNLKEAFLPLLAFENPVTLSLKLHRTILPSLMEKINIGHVLMLTDDGSTLLHLSTRLLLSDISSQLINKGADVNKRNGEGNSPAHSIFRESVENSWQKEGFVETLSALVNNGADINLLNVAGVSTFRYAFETEDKRILGLILSHTDKLDCLVEDFFTVYNRQWPDIFKKMLSLQKDDFKKHLVVLSIEKGMDDFIDFILKIASENLKESIIEDSLYTSATIDNETMFNKFISIKIQNPKFFSCGQTLFTRLIIEKNVKYSLKLVKSDVGERYLDFANQHGQTPLYLAAEMESLKLCKYLVLETQNLDYKDVNDETAMEKLLKSSTNTNDKEKLKKIEKIVKMMIHAGVDINRLNRQNQRAINFCQNVNLKEKLEIFNDKNKSKHPKLSIPIDEEKNTCEICLNEQISCQFGCGHPFCRTCASKVTICPKCRRPTENIFPLYLP